ncbi:MAG: hypothetical protein JNK84_22225 [Phreatobacter sp.]|nr:hypothetical protein [Phreatobacter sp.]MBL8571802.1 hypothetical protein [Phreatobacter sp.]
MTRGVPPRIAQTDRRAAPDEMAGLVALSLVAGLAAALAVLWRSLV